VQSSAEQNRHMT